ncbi:MAG: serine/threonine protein kinase [Phycisphaerales bacterium]|nr:serine/threonine protein kinase [Phycisphaerales bacterium]
MPAEVMEQWLRSGKAAQINGGAFFPLEHGQWKGIPLSIQRGQAEAFILVDPAANRWILKKFHQQRGLERPYLMAISILLPREEGFKSGTERQILSAGMLHKQRGAHYCKALDHWLNGTILMPRIQGMDWAALADELRDGSRQLDRSQRIALCRNLSRLIRLLEAHQCSHRDLSSGNVFIDLQTFAVYLIDFDSLYHPSLSIPAATTCGTVGYTPPYAWRGGDLNPRVSWCPRADRYALTLLIVEFLILGPGAVLTAEGGMLNQDELRTRSGRGLNAIKNSLKTDYPEAVAMFEATLRSGNFDQCPSPEDWIGFCDRVTGPAIKPPPLDDLETIAPDYFDRLLMKRRPVAVLWPAPRLEDLPGFELPMPAVNIPVVTLPPDPWRT